MGCASALERLVLHAFSTGGHVRLDFPGWGFLLFLVATIVDHVYPDPFILLWGVQNAFPSVFLVLVIPRWVSFIPADRGLFHDFSIHVELASTEIWGEPVGRGL